MIKIFSIKEVSEMLKVTERCLYNWIKKGLAESINVKGKTFFSEETLADLNNMPKSKAGRKKIKGKRPSTLLAEKVEILEKQIAEMKEKLETKKIE